MSVIISTRNRAERIRSVIRSFEKCAPTEDAEWELVIVNNGSSDHTERVLEAEKGNHTLPLVILHQPVPGKCRAINYALVRTKGDLIILSDDDMEPCVGWLDAYAKACRAHPEVCGFTGRIEPSWEGALPAWLGMEGPYAVPEGVTNRRDFGGRERLLPKAAIPGGGNTALRKSVFDELGGFREDLGPGTKIPLAEDTEFFTRYLEAGGRFVYLPQALMYHHNAADRMRKSYVVDWVRQAGRCQVLAFKALGTAPTILGIPRYLVLQLLERLSSWWMEPRAAKRFYKRLRAMHTLGEIQGYLGREKDTSPE